MLPGWLKSKELDIQMNVVYLQNLKVKYESIVGLERKSKGKHHDIDGFKSTENSIVYATTDRHSFPGTAPY